MAKFVLNVKPEVCTANGKDPAATELLKKMELYGEVTPFDTAVAADRAEDKATIENLTAQVFAIKDQELTADEIKLLNFYRVLKAELGEGFQKIIDSQAATLEDVRVKSLARAAQITELATQLAELSAE